MPRKTRVPSDRWEAEGDDALELLANHLAKNYFEGSLPFIQDESYTRRVGQHVFAKGFAEIDQLKRGRNILVLGAGASVAAFGPLACPATDEAIGIIREKLFEMHGKRARAFIRKRLDQEHARLANLYGLTPAQNDFETQLAVLSSVYPVQDIRTVLVDIYGNRRWPHITFEIIAHLLKHRFVDAIINFNFDELLDQAITEEIGLAQFDYVTSDGHCRNLDALMIGNRLKVPLYIKPHGTVSHPSTLRFTKHDYVQLPEAMRAFMEKIVRGYWTDEQEKDEKRKKLKPYRINIISIGFAMRSLELLQILRASDSDTAIYHVNTDRFADQALEMRHLTEVDDQNFISVSQDGLDGVLRKLWSMINSRFAGLYTPRGLARHEIVHSLFYSAPGGGEGHEGHRVPAPPPSARGGTPDLTEETYLTARLCTEIVIALARGNGRIDLTSVADDRLGEYFDRLSRVKEKKKEPFSLEDIRKRFDGCLVMDGNSENVLVARFAYNSANPAEASHDLAMWLKNALCTALASLGDEELLQRAMASHAHDGTEFVALLAGLVASDLQTISADFRHRHLLLFTQPNPDDVLHTNLGLTIRFVELANRDWDLMLAVSEHGKALEKYRSHARQEEVPPLSEKWFSVLVAQTAHDNVTDERLEDPEFSERLLGGMSGHPFYRSDFTKQDHHMIVFLKRLPEEGKWRVVGGIQFDKPGQQRQVNPIVIEAKADGGERNEMDLIRLRNCFFGYVDAALRQEEKRWDHAQPDGPAVDAGSELDRAKWRAKTLLAEWWRKIEESTNGGGGAA